MTASLFGETEIVSKLPSLSLSSVITDNELLFDENLDDIKKYTEDETQKIIDSINSSIDPMTSVSSSSSMPSVMETDANAVWDILSSSQNSNPKPFRKIITANYPALPETNDNTLSIPKTSETKPKSNSNSNSSPKKKQKGTQRPQTARRTKKGTHKKHKNKKKQPQPKSLKSGELSKTRGKKKKKRKKKSYKIRDQNRYSSYLTNGQPRMWKYRSRARSQVSSPAKKPKKKSKTKRRKTVNKNNTPKMIVYSKSMKKPKKNKMKIRSKTKTIKNRCKRSHSSSISSKKKKRNESIPLQNVRSISDDSEVKVKRNRTTTKCTHKKYADRKTTKKSTKTTNVSKTKKKKKRKKQKHLQLSSISLSTTLEMHSDSVTAMEHSITPPEINNSSQDMYLFPEIIADVHDSDSSESTPTYDSSNSTYEAYPEAKDLSANHMNRVLSRTNKSLSMSALTMDEFFDDSFNAIYGTFHQSFSSNNPLKLNTNAYLYPIPDATEPEVEDEIVEVKEEKKEQIEKLINVWGKKVNECPMTSKNKNVDKQMVLEWRFVCDDNVAHTVVLHHEQHSKKLKNKTKRMILVDGQLEYDQVSNKCEFILKIGSGMIEFVIQIVFDKKGKRYSYPVTIDGICYAETFRLWMAKNKI